MMNRMSIRRLGLLVLAAVCAGGASAADGTLKWIGSPQGGDWCDAANWQLVGTSSMTVAELVASGKTIWDFGDLADGAVVSNNAASVYLGGIQFSARANVGTIHLCGTKDFIFPNEHVTISIAAGNTIEWEQNHTSPWTNDHANKKLVVGGSGTLHVNPATAFQTYKLDLQPCTWSTVIIGPRVVHSRSFITMWNNATLKFESDSTVGQLFIPDAGCTLDLQGHTLTVGSGEYYFSSAYAICGKIVGSGDIVWSGGQYHNLFADSRRVDLTDYSARWTLYDTRIVYAPGVTIPESIGYTINGPGALYLNNPATLYDLRGGGATGRVVTTNDAPVTLTTALSTPTNETYAARITGAGGVVKRGADYTLTLTGDNRYQGATTVAEGTLRLKRPLSRKGLLYHWSFEDADDLGRDSAAFGKSLLLSGGVLPTQVPGVNGGKGIHLNSSLTATSYLQDGNMVKTEWGMPIGSNAVSVALWIRPGALRTNPSYVYRHGDWAKEGGQLMFWILNKGEKIGLCIDNWKTSDSDDSPVINTPDLMDGNWHHVAASYGDGHLSLWYDGELKSTKTTTHPLNIRSGCNMILGYTDTSNNNMGYEGDIDEVTIWDRVLTTEEVAAEYNFTPTASATNAVAALPDPVCHWAFRNLANLGVDEMGHADLEAHPNVTAAWEVNASSAAIDGQVTGLNTAFYLPESRFPANFPRGKSPFTVSVRMGLGVSAEQRPLITWGDYDLAGTSKFFMGIIGCPRTCVASFKTYSTCYSFGRSFCGSNGQDGSMLHFVAVVDPANGWLRLYRDGVQVLSASDASFSIGSGGLYLNGMPGNASTTQVRFDDVRIYDRALTPGQVQILSRTLDTGTLGPVLPAESPVTVASGATLRVEGEGHAVKSLAGAGTVEIDGVSTLQVSTWNGFTGTVTGRGALLLGDQGNGPTAATVQTTVGFADDVVALRYATAAQPLVTTTNRVVLPLRGTLKLADADATSGKWAGRVFTIATCGSYNGPATTEGWTFEPSREGDEPEGRFIFADGVLRLRMKGGGTVFVVR